MRITIESIKLRNGDAELPIAHEPITFTPGVGRHQIIPELTAIQDWTDIGFDVTLWDLPENLHIVDDGNNGVAWDPLINYPQSPNYDITVNPFWETDSLYIAVESLNGAFIPGTYDLLAIEFIVTQPAPNQNVLRIRVVQVQQ